LYEGTAKIAKVNTLLIFSGVSGLFLETKLRMHKVVRSSNFSVEGGWKIFKRFERSSWKTGDVWKVEETNWCRFYPKPSCQG